jgi:uncharacterized protein
MPPVTPTQLPHRLADILTKDPLRYHALTLVRDLNLADGWIAAGFVRDAVWDHLHERTAKPPTGDTDVIWFNPGGSEHADAAYEALLKAQAPELRWSVKNQAGMHARNDDAPYRDAPDAMRHWPETATTVAVRLTCDDRIEVAAPFGLDDLFALRLRPAPHFNGPKRRIFDERVATKRWLERYPLLRNVVTTPHAISACAAK